MSKLRSVLPSRAVWGGDERLPTNVDLTITTVSRLLHRLPAPGSDSAAAMRAAATESLAAARDRELTPRDRDLPRRLHGPIARRLGRWLT